MDKIDVWKVNKKDGKENFKGFLDSETGKIDAIQSEWDGSVVTRDISPEAFDRND